ncbi:MAG: septum site-determining protein MinD [Chloroflexia bacterium]|nr:septum site-determining protein MinD [Chloroflexia bacterium]
MSRVITITSGKGGVGKTTATANLSTALAMLGRRVVAIDADIGLRNLDIVMGLENRIVYDLVDVVEGRCRLRQAMIKDKRLNDLYLIPAAQTRDKTAITPADMAEVCRQLQQEFDFVVVDSPAGIEQGFKNAVAGATEVLIVTTPEVSAVRDADRIVGLVEAEEKDSPRLIINRLNPKMVEKGEMLSVNDVVEILAIRLVGIIPEDTVILTSTNRGIPAVLENRSQAGQAFMHIARRLLGEDIPLILPEEPKLWDRLTKWMRGQEL